jgi:hypothetical protein
MRYTELRPLGQIIVGCFEAAWNDNEVFSLDKTIEPQFIEERLDLWCLPCGGEQEAETGRCGLLPAPAPPAATRPPLRRAA